MKNWIATAFGCCAAAAALAAPGEAFKRASGEQTLRFRGQATMNNAQVQAEASNIALALARAYIAPFLNGNVDGNAKVRNANDIRDYLRKKL